MDFLIRSPSRLVFANEQEQSYFQRFCVNTVDHFSGAKGSDFWKRTVLQASDAQPCIRHAVAAIGALDLGKVMTKVDESVKTRSDFAYREYEKAISGLRKALVSKNCDIRTQLISTILFCCFEAYHENTLLAHKQAFIGIEMMADYNKRRRQLALTNNTRLPPIDKTLVEAFDALEIPMSTVYDQRSSAVHLERMLTCSEAIENIPSEFKTCEEAGFVIRMILMCGIHLRFGQKPNDSMNQAHGFWVRGSCQNEFSNAKIRELLLKLQQWDVAFEPLLKIASSREGDKLEAAQLLRLEYLSTLLWTASQSPYVSTYYRQYTKELTELVQLGIVLSNKKAKEQYTFDTQLVLPFAMVGHYRHRALRKQAIQILFSMPQREVVLNGSTFAKTMQWIADVEEEGLSDEEYIPEDKVVDIVEFTTDEEDRSMKIGYFKSITSDREFKRATIYY